MEYIRYVGKNGQEYPLKKDAEHPGMGGGCVGYKTYGKENFTSITPLIQQEPVVVANVEIPSATNEVSDDIESLELSELRAKAKALGIKASHLLQKNTLIAKIKEVSQK